MSLELTVLLAWAREGDLLVLHVNELANRAQLVALLDEMAALGWRAGAAVPEQP
ncbi:hypothetical protein [Pseudoxanthomonas winnipegensis]|uniref:hypothetical protein n=1 Tax=Pseudoxanthomonas winnipegensis TaxID=2480810 RepID=UPI0013EEAF73|nr:hypothetical protein [Pseudoxanthomonas winnipegensis]